MGHSLISFSQKRTEVQIFLSIPLTVRAQTSDLKVANLMLLPRTLALRGLTARHRVSERASGGHCGVYLFIHLLFSIYFYQLETNYFTVLQWFLPYIDMNQS